MESQNQLNYVNGKAIKKESPGLAECMMKENCVFPSENDFELVELIATGGWSNVYRATTESFKTHNEVIIKQVAKFTDWKKTINELDFGIKFQHPNLVRTLGAFYNGFPSIVLEIANGPLSHFTPAHNEANYLLFDALKGLTFLHENKFVHCDIKQDNLLVFGNKLKISDFGSIAKLDETTGIAKLDRIWGTYSFQSLNVFENICYGPADDLHSLAQSFFEVMSNQKLKSPRFDALKKLCAENNKRFYADTIKFGKIKEDNSTGLPIFLTGNGKLDEIFNNPTTVGRQSLLDRVNSVNNPYWAKVLSFMLNIDDQASETCRSVQDVLEYEHFITIKPCTKSFSSTMRQHDTLARRVIPHKIQKAPRESEILLSLQFLYYDEREIIPSAARKNRNKTVKLRIPKQERIVHRSYERKTEATRNSQPPQVAVKKAKRVRAGNSSKKAKVQKIQNKSLICDICQKNFSHVNSLNRHKTEVHMKTHQKFQCVICEEIFKRKEFLTKHLSRIHGEFVDNKRQDAPKEVPAQVPEDTLTNSNLTSSDSSTSASSTDTMMSV